MRKLLQILSQRVVLRRRLPAASGGARLFVTPASSLRYWRRDLGRIDPELFQAVDELVQPGNVVWDVGANVGLFAFAAAFRAGPQGRVVALEPHHFLYGLLQRSAAGLPAAYAPVDVLSCAVAERVHLARLQIGTGGLASNTLGEGNSQFGSLRGSQPVLAFPLDWLLEYLPAPDVLKIDVEGTELAVLDGAVKLLSTHRPRLHIELSADASFDLLRAHNYVLFDAEQPVASRQPLTRRAFNAIAVPAELL